MTDESEFSLRPTSNPRNDIVWARTREEVPPIEQEAHSPSVRFWAGASALGRTKLHFFSGNLNGVEYRKILEKALPEMKKIFGVKKWTFQHDGASAHKDKKTNAWLEANVPNFIKSGPQGDWPAKSPDLNWIENIFGIMNDKLDDPEPPTTLAGLKRKLTKIWNEIPTETFRKCADDMPTRLKEVIQRNGKPLDK
jgi:hypothetical protein